MGKNPALFSDHYCDHALSFVRPSSLTFHIFDFFSETVKRNSTTPDRKQDLKILYQVFRDGRKNKMAALASDWRRHFRLLLWNRRTAFNETRQEARSQRPKQSLCFRADRKKQDGRPGLWLSETFSTSPLKPLNGIQRNLTGSNISTSSTKFVFFWADRKNKMAAPPLIVWDVFDFSSDTAERNSTKLGRQQDLGVLYQVCVFRVNKKNKMATLAFDWLRNFQLILWDHRTGFNETWHETRYRRPLPSLCFSGRSENKMAARLLIGWDIVDFSSETAERNSTKLDRKQDLYVLYQVCIFQADEQKRPPWPICHKGGTLYSGARYGALWASCVSHALRYFFILLCIQHVSAVTIRYEGEVCQRRAILRLTFARLGSTPWRMLPPPPSQH